ncbi:MAG: hypothetical protein SVM79_10240 [Chloroflexota bacterium]|nr:hypothetical protein [Chloroflexota bacterium]
MIEGKDTENNHLFDNRSELKEVKTSMRKHSLLLVSSIVSFLLLSVGGCGNADGNLDFKAVIEEAKDASSLTTSYSYVENQKVIIEATATEPGKSFEKTDEFNTQYRFVSPHRVWDKIEVKSSWAEEPVGDRISESVTIDNTHYSRSYQNGRHTEWKKEEWPRKSQGVLAPSSAFWFEIDSITEVNQLPAVELNGVECLHFEGNVDIEKYIAKVMPLHNLQETDAYIQWLGNSDISIEVWIGENDRLIRQIKMEERNPFTGPDREELSRSPNTKALYNSEPVTVFDDYDQPIQIEAPM